jgi:glyoxylase-like metal-dependent hydrolase (beta-lactamase superfamily II)
LASATSSVINAEARAALHFETHGALLVGDAFATYAVTTGWRGPRIAFFTADRPRAVASLRAIEDIPVDVVLSGHGDPWTEGIAEAVRIVREIERSNGERNS